jgi:adenosylmethionine-8-amino-7-oxononanoate transaminase
MAANSTNSANTDNLGDGDHLGKDLAKLDHDHVWHPFTAMRQWREQPALIIERADGDYLIDTAGQRYIDGVSSLWCNVHGHRVPQIDQAIRDQLDKVAHTTLLGMGSPPSIELAAKLADRSPGKLNKVFYSDAGATALEVAFKMAVGYFHHIGSPAKSRFIGMSGAYHGDTTGSMSVGYSDLFHKAFISMVFDTAWFPTPDCCRVDEPQWLEYQQRASQSSQTDHRWPSEDAVLMEQTTDHCLAGLKQLLEQQGDQTAAVVIEPVMQGAAGMICQPPGFVKRVADLAHQYDVLLIADEVATGFGRTGAMFACELDNAQPDIMCLGKGISGGYLPLAATLCTDAIEESFCGELADRRTFYHGHTYTGNALACAAALASLDLFDSTQLLDHTKASADRIAQRLNVLRDPDRFGHVLDIRQRGLMVGIELCSDRNDRKPFDFSRGNAAALCLAMRDKGVILRPLGDVLVLMPIPAMSHQALDHLLDVVIESLGQIS